jgi:thioesterase domain-containing protein
VLRYQTLTRYLEDQPLYTLQPPEFALAQEPYPTIALLAERFVVEIKAIQAGGPYAVGGWSFGGLVALEIAQQLRRQGDEVELLALFDSFTPAEVPDFDAGQLLVRYAGVLGLSIEAGPLKSLSHRDQMIHSVLEQLRSARLLPPGIGPTQVQQLLHSAEVIVQVIRRYTPQPYAGHAVFFRAAEWAAPGSTADPAPAWRPLLTGSSTIETVPGSHGTLFDEPNVEALARYLSACRLPLPSALAGG